jgi:hypothetical protein
MEKNSSCPFKTNRKAWSTTLHHGGEAKKQIGMVATDGLEHPSNDLEVKMYLTGG